MHLPRLSSLLVLLTTTATGQLFDPSSIAARLTSAAGSRVSDFATSQLASYTGPGASQLLSVVSNPTQAQSLFSEGTPAAQASATATSTAGANVNANAKAVGGVRVDAVVLGAVVVVGGGWIMA